MYEGLTGLATPAAAGLPLYSCCRLPFTPSMHSIFDRLQTPHISAHFLPATGLGCAGFHCSPPADGLPTGVGLGLDLRACRTPGMGLGLRRWPPTTMLLCPTPHYAVTLAPADLTLGCDENKTTASAAAAGCGGDRWVPNKSSSIAELRLKAQQYAAMLDMC